MATLTQRGGQWLLRWTEGGQRQSKSLGRVGVFPKRDAEAVLKAKQIELALGTQMLARPRGGAPTFGHYCKEYLVWHAFRYPDSNERIDQIIHQHLLPEFQFTPLDMLRPAQVEEWMRKRLRTAAPETVTKELRTLKAVVHHAQDRDVIGKDPLRMVEAPRNTDDTPHRFYETDELEAIYAAAFDKDPVWRLLANTGMRRTEALQLDWRWVGKEGLRVVSTGADRTKSGKSRDIPLTAGALLALDVLREHGGKGRVLPAIAPESLSRSFIKDAAKATVVRGEVEVHVGGHMHLLRHTYISHLVRRGVPLRTVQIYAGHASYTTTEQYAYLAPGIAPTAVTELSL